MSSLSFLIHSVHRVSLWAFCTPSPFQKQWLSFGFSSELHRIANCFLSFYSILLLLLLLLSSVLLTPLLYSCVYLFSVLHSLRLGLLPSVFNMLKLFRKNKNCGAPRKVLSLVPSNFLPIFVFLIFFSILSAQFCIRSLFPRLIRLIRNNYTEKIVQMKQKKSKCAYCLWFEFIYCLIEMRCVLTTHWCSLTTSSTRHAFDSHNMDIVEFTANEQTHNQPMHVRPKDTSLEWNYWK